MKIKTRLTISTIISVSLALTIGVVILLSTYKVNQKAEYTKKTDELFRLINELKFLTDEYFLRNVERVQPQWESRFQSISQLLRSLESEGYVAKEVINEMQGDHKYIRKSFDKLVLAYERKEKSDQEFAELLLEYKERLAGQLLTGLNELIYDSIQLSQVLKVEINTTKTKTMWFIILFVITMVSVTGIISFMARRSISKSILELQEGAKVIGSGNLNTRINIDSKDEMGELAVTFNQMVDDLKKSNSELRESEEQNRNVLRTALDGFWVVDIEGRILEINDAYCNLTGYSREELLKMRISDVEAIEKPEDTEKHIQHIIETGGDRFESRHRCKDGRIIDIDVSANYVKTSGGRFFVFIRDITERKEAEKRLEASEKKYQDLYNNAPDMFVSVDAETAKILQCNQTFLKALGYNKEEIIGQPVFSVYHPDCMEDAKEAFHSFRTTGKVSNSELQLKRKDGSKVEVILNVSAVCDEQGKILYSRSVWRDNTERKKMEEVLLQTEKLRAMGIMTSGVAHDFNNILAIISGHTQLLKGNYKEDKELTDIISIIYRAAKDGAGIVHRMRQFTKMERDATEFVTVNIKNALEEAVDFLRPRWMNVATASGKPFNMDVNGLKEIPSILGNPSELREAFINIINNAMDAMSKGGCLSFRTWSGKDTVIVSITDTGEGMSEDVKKRIFDPFFTTKRAEGSGLGMSEVYGIVTRHGGKIDVSSEVGKGTTFTLKFPIATENTQEKVLPVPVQKETTRNLRILVVDDEKDICNILNTLFSRDGHDVKIVTSGKEGIDLIKSEEFDLVLSDLVMPGLSGHDVVKAIDELDKRPKVGLITGWKEEVEINDKEGLNVDFIIRKPFDLSEITKHINDLFET